MQPQPLYVIPPSRSTGKARSYIIKNGLRYREVTPGTAHFDIEDVLDRADLRPVLDARLARSIVRENNLEVWR